MVHKLADGTTYRQYDLTKNRTGCASPPSFATALRRAACSQAKPAGQLPFHTWKDAPQPRASAVATGPDPLPPTQWNLPRLLAPAESFTDDNAPTWIYLTREGSNPLDFSAELQQKETAGAANPKFVIGRYAYNLYDTSGLLDINVAGHPVDKPGAERVGGKGSLLMADLAGLPGMSATAVAALAAWKHEWTASTAESTEDYLRKSEGSGWRRMVDNDNVFLSRQDLLDFAEQQPDSPPEADTAVPDPFLARSQRADPPPRPRPPENRPQRGRRRQRRLRRRQHRQPGPNRLR